MAKTIVETIQKAQANPFGIATVSRPDWDMSVRDGKMGKSVHMLNVSVPILSCGLTVNAAIYAGIPATGPDAGSFVIEPNVSAKAVKITDKYDRERFKTHALNAAQAWPGYAKLEAEAEAMLTGEAVKRDADASMRPRLVRKLASHKPIVDASSAGTTETPAS